MTACVLHIYNCFICLFVCFFISFINFLWFSPGTLVSSTNKTDSYVIAEILLKVVLNTISLSLPIEFCNLEMVF